MSYYNNKTNIPLAKVEWGRGRSFYCPYCSNRIENHEINDYADDEIHPCEHCSKPVLWTSMWDKKDIRD